MKVLSAVEIGALVKELQFLVNSKVSKIYQPDKEETVFAFHTTGEGKSMLRIFPGVCLYLTDKKKPSPKKPFGFCNFLRKRLHNSRLVGIEQKHFERIIEFTFQTKEEKFVMIAEFFSKGNVILCDEEYMILSALQVQHWKDRTIKAKVKYVYPPTSNVNIFHLSFEDFRKLVKESDKENIVKTLAMDFGFGGTYAEELCSRSKVDKNKKGVTEKELNSLFSALDDLKKLKIEANLSNEEPFPFTLTSKKKEKEFSTFNLALDFYYSSFIEDELEVEEKTATSKVDRQYAILESQQEQLEEAKKSIEENTEKGNKIYEHYSYIKEVIDTIDFARKKNIPWKEIREKLKQKSIILNDKEKKVTLSLK